MAAIATASSPSAKSTPIITRSPRRTATRCCRGSRARRRGRARCARAEDDADDRGERRASATTNADDDDADGEHEARTATKRRGRHRLRPARRSTNRAADELRKRRQALRRRYKIQDVIQRRQVLLVQVVKEERGNKGAALTTYLSLAGRYCVLMPNTSHGGGISRKISNGADRKRLKSIMSDLNLPSTMGLIVRTAGLSRTKVEIKRDFDYLARLWDEIRERTLKSSAPALIYRDSDLIKRAIRDLYNREIDEVIVEGEEGYKAARGFMKLLMPSHVRRVKQHTDADAAVPALRGRGPAVGDVPAGRPAEVGRLSGDQPDRGSGFDRHQLGPLDPRAQYRADRLRDQPRGGGAKSPASCACATWPAWSSSTSSTWSSRATSAKSRRR